MSATGCWQCDRCELLNAAHRKECQACFIENPNEMNDNLNEMSAHEKTLRHEFFEIISSSLPQQFEINLITQLITDFAYPIHYGVYAAFTSNVLLINKNGTCKYKWHDTYFTSPLKSNLESNSEYGSIEYFHKIGEENITYYPWETWNYDFKTNTIKIRAFSKAHCFSWALQAIGEIKYGNSSYRYSEGTWEEQSDYEWHLAVIEKYADVHNPQSVNRWTNERWNNECTNCARQHCSETETKFFWMSSL